MLASPRPFCLAFVPGLLGGGVGAHAAGVGRARCNQRMRFDVAAINHLGPWGGGARTGPEQNYRLRARMALMAVPGGACCAGRKDAVLRYGFGFEPLRPECVCDMDSGAETL